MKRARTPAPPEASGSALAGSSTGRLLALLLEAPDWVDRLRSLDGPTVAALIRRVGLEDAGELIALLTVEQLTELLDDVLWSADEPGAEERFRPRRFITWLEVMLEAGDEFAADRLADLSEDLLVLAVSRCALVLELTEVEASATAREDGELVEKALDGCLHQELGDYFLIARRHDGWDALVTALVALGERHGERLERILGRCWRGAHELLEDAGDLFSLLTGEELFEVDAAAEREDRRAALGYVSPASARALLDLASRGLTGLEPGVEDAITRAYFRELDGRRVRQRAARAPSPPELRQLLGPGPAEPGAATRPSAARAEAPTLRALLGELVSDDPARHGRTVDELAYLANVLLTGDTAQGRPLRAAAAAEHVLLACDRGLTRLAHRDGAASPSLATLKRWGLVAAFRAGFAPAER